MTTLHSVTTCMALIILEEPYPKALYPRWHLGQLYVSNVLNKDVPYTLNKNNGATLSVRKLGGWSKAWVLACDLAAWPEHSRMA